MNETHLISTWMIYFFLYSFIGWIWESCYVSFCQHKWVNRGFIRGPFLPLYGSGAVIMLLVSEPFSDNLILVYFSGFIAATILEYITGALMEALFKVRYWDYSNQKFNLNGYICLSSSIVWGFFTILMTRYVHPAVVRLLALVPPIVQNFSLIVITAVFVYDFAAAFKNALQFRSLLEKMAAARDDLAELSEKLENSLRENLANAKATFSDNLEGVMNKNQLLRELSEKRASFSETLQRYRKTGSNADKITLRRQLKAFSGALERVSSEYNDSLSGIPGRLSERIAQWKEQISRMAGSTTDRQRRLLKNHSHTVSKKYTLELELLKERLRDGSSRFKKED